MDAIETAKFEDVSDSSSLMPFSYEFLLDRAFQEVSKGETAKLTSASERIKVKKPVYLRMSKKRTAWTNFPDFCSKIQRKPEDVSSFFGAQMQSKTYFTSSSGHLTFRGRFSEKAVEDIIRNFLKEQVQCHLCKSYKTERKRNLRMRSWVVECNSCKGIRSLEAFEKPPKLLAKLLLTI